MKHRAFTLFVSASLLGGSLSLADDTATTQPAATTKPAVTPDLLGSEYSSEAYGLSLRPPPGCAEIHTPSPDTIVEFDNAQLDWKIMVRRVSLQESIPLTIHNDQFGKPVDGLIEKTIQKFQQDEPGAEIIDADSPQVINVGRVRVGEIYMRFSNAQQQRRFLQEAIVEAPDANFQLYYVVDFISAARPAGAAAAAVDPIEKQANDTFNQMIDSIKLLDRAKIVEDQRERLYHTHALFVNWGGNGGQPIRSALIPQQWQRIVKNGKDIGYSYTEESPEDAKANDPLGANIRISIRTRIMPTAGVQWDTGTVMHSTIDRKHESWSNVARCVNAKGDMIAAMTQFGTSNELTKAVIVEDKPKNGAGFLGQGEADPNDTGPLGQGPNVDVRTVRTLEVKTNLNRTDMDPFQQDTPVFYIPQAISTIIPRLVPLDTPKGYMFGTFVSTPQQEIGKGTGGGKVMSRYVDVLPIQQINFNNQTFTGVPINDRIGLTGPVTTTYMTSEGRFVGSTCTYDDGKDADGNNVQSTLVILPTDPETLERIWTHPDLTAPQETTNDPGVLHGN